MPLSRLTRRGVTLVELIVAMVLLSLLSGAALRAMVAVSRQSVAVTEHASVQAGVRTGMLLTQAEFRALGADAWGSDLIRIAPDSVTFRAQRGFGVTCAVALNQIRILNAGAVPYSALRGISPGRDSLLLFVEGNPDSTSDDQWIRAPILSIGSAPCAGSPAILVGTVDLTPLLPSGSLADIVPGGPVRTFEVVRLAEYASGGARWLGMASVSGGELIQPVAGPLSGPGLTLEYFGSGGAEVTDPTAVTSIRVSLVGTSERLVARNWSGSGNSFVAETISTRLYLRNRR